MHIDTHSYISMFLCIINYQWILIANKHSTSIWWSIPQALKTQFCTHKLKNRQYKRYVTHFDTTRQQESQYLAIRIYVRKIQHLFKSVVSYAYRMMPSETNITPSEVKILLLVFLEKTVYDVFIVREEEHIW